jgi:hypothetical protein
VEMGTICRLRPYRYGNGTTSVPDRVVVAPRMSHRLIGWLIVTFGILALLVVVESVAAMRGGDQHLPAPTGVHTMPTPDPARY